MNKTLDNNRYYLFTTHKLSDSMYLILLFVYERDYWILLKSTHKNKYECVNTHNITQVVFMSCVLLYIIANGKHGYVARRYWASIHVQLLQLPGIQIVLCVVLYYLPRNTSHRCAASFSSRTPLSTCKNHKRSCQYKALCSMLWIMQLLWWDNPDNPCERATNSNCNVIYCLYYVMFVDSRYALV